MKKNLLTLLFVMAFVCGGLLVSEVRASTDSSKAAQNFNVKGSKSIKNSEFYRKYAELQRFCKTNPGTFCDDAIEHADAVAQWAWEGCTRWIQSCFLFQDIALEELEWAMDVCRRESGIPGPLAFIQKREKLQYQNILTIKREKSLDTK